MDDLKKLSLICEQCGGTLMVDDGKEVMACPYCGNKTLIVESDAVTMERIRTTAQKEVELEKIKAVDREQQRILEKEEKQELNIQAENFKKSKWFKVLIFAFLIAVLCAYICFSRGRILAGALSVLQAGCFGMAWVMGMQIIKEKKRYMHILIAIVGIILIVPTFRACNKADDIKEVKWGVIFLGEAIPEPDSKKLDIHTNTAEELWIDVTDTSDEDYYEYVVACKELGYTIEVEEYSSGYSAYNEDGYFLELSNHGYSEEMSIQLKAPRVTEELDWGKHNISTVLPAPVSKSGVFEIENEERVVVIVSKTTNEEFLQYCYKCKSLGFEIEAETNGDDYIAFDGMGNKLNLSYTNGSSEMKIVLEYPMKFSDITWPTVGVGTLAPAPNSLSGNIINDCSWAYSVYIANTTKDEYETYAQKCIESGFDKDVRKYENSVHADYSEDINLHIEYKGFDIMYVSITGKMSEDYSYLSEIIETDETVINEPEVTQVPDTIEVPEMDVEFIDPEFKEMMDSYEAFFDEYVDFINKFNNADSIEVLELMSSYTDYMEQYAETMEKLSDINQDDLSAAEALYYAEVMARIYQKLEKL